jgi:hypothetical protein
MKDRRTGRDLCDGLRPSLGDRTCWVVVTGAGGHRVDDGQTPARRAGDRIAFLYHRGYCCGSVRYDVGPHDIFDDICRTTWALRDTFLEIARTVERAAFGLPVADD